VRVLFTREWVVYTTKSLSMGHSTSLLTSGQHPCGSWIRHADMIDSRRVPWNTRSGGVMKAPTRDRTPSVRTVLRVNQGARGDRPGRYGLLASLRLSSFARRRA
jgi:hypothetical protein